MIRHLASSGVDPYTALSGSAGALFGERKSPRVISMLKKIGSVLNVANFLQELKNSNSINLPGFGHRAFQSCDPRSKIGEKLFLEVF
jgi:citrate synthase